MKVRYARTARRWHRFYITEGSATRFTTERCNLDQANLEVFDAPGEGTRCKWCWPDTNTPD